MKDIKELRKEIDQIDKEISSLYEKRMEIAKEVALYKKENNLPIFNKEREQEVINNNVNNINNDILKPLYKNFLLELMNESKIYQNNFINDKNVININLKDNSYQIIIKKGVLDNIKDYLPDYHKILVVSDDNIPDIYLDKLKRQFSNIYIIRFPHGEAHKSIDSYQLILSALIKNEFNRKDAIIALGGGLTSDLAGLVSSTYMRGIDFYIIPTTLLSQCDASIGGKVAINYSGVKNLIGTFYQPKKVFIDINTLKSLDERLFNEGLAEIIKMATIYDKDLFEIIENCADIHPNIEEIIYRSLLIKKDIVEKDEKENNLRSILNFGHTIGHAIEALGKGKYYHGEAIAIGMMYCSFNEAHDRIKSLLNKYHLPTKDEFETSDLIEVIKLDKKAHDNVIKIVEVDKIGSYILKDVNKEELYEMMERQKHEK